MTLKRILAVLLSLGVLAGSAVFAVGRGVSSVPVMASDDPKWPTGG